MGGNAENPIFELAAQGQRFENRGEIDAAIDSYYKALACLPNHFGGGNKIRYALPSGAVRIEFTPQHAARIYAAMGRSLAALDRRDDSLLARRAARQLELQHDGVLTGDADPLPRAQDGNGGGITTEDLQIVAPVDLERQVTLVAVTHFAGNLKKYSALSPPSTKLVTAMYGSVLHAFGDVIGRCPKFLCYDHNPAGSEKDESYLRALKSFSKVNDFDLCIYEHVGLFAILKDIVAEVRTPHILFVEHDWLFQGDPIRLDVIIEEMNRDTNMNAVRFNKRENYLDGLDFIMEVREKAGGYPLLRTSSHSNNPSIFRTEKLRETWLPYCGEALRRIHADLKGSAYGVEEVLFKRHVEDIRNLGFKDAHDRWGTYVFGRVGDPPRVLHIGE